MEYIEKVWPNVQEEEKIVEEEGAPEDMESQLPVSNSGDLEEIVGYEVDRRQEEKLTDIFEGGSDEIKE